ncbi:GNAT family N-acetyltransferase [Massilia niastensis]|uniref:GNAT family N-acetyltransferase n=1 Tax=Massilia niastensis TaxID=544911 RepID=UPI00036C48AB|nr:GNAT family N-acetyltransferase [Massilia niastensis]
MLLRRTATSADLVDLWDLRTRAVRATCAAHYPPDVIDTWCASAAPTALPLLVQAGGALVAEEDGRVVGYAILNTGTGEVDAVFVEPTHQGRGIALDLLRRLEAMACARRLPRMFLSASLNAVPFYERAGFRSVREEVYPHRSGIGIRSVFMEMPLPRPS